jgi:hypothetical protein
MRLSELLSEMPTDLNKDAPFEFNVDGTYISNGALKRDFDFLGELTLDKTVYNFYLSKKLNRGLVTTITLGDTSDLRDGNNEPVNLIVVDLHLKRNDIVNVSKGLQVETVSVNSKYESLGFSGILYVVIARYGYKVISDFEQYNGGVGLWKKIARLSIIRKYAVRIWDIANDDWVKDETGTPIKYTEQNLQKDRVWNKIGSSPQTLLVLFST